MHRPQRAAVRTHEPQRDEDQRARKHFYDSAAWDAAREAKRRRDPYCQMCAAMGIITPVAHIDHWIPIALGGDRLADENLVSLCLPCHSRKTLCERNGTPFPRIVESKPRQFSVA
jgi:5-methylcytosine-specific restriction endonuclease McrA